MAMDLNFIYMIVGFMFAAYSVVANDSIQTLGTFISSQQKIKWYWLWIPASIILVSTMVYGWHVNDGDLAFGRLSRIPHPEQFHILHMLAPMALLVLTRYGMPVSTTFLVLSVFANTVVLEKMLMKSVMGYAVAAVASYAIWFGLAKLFNEHEPVKDEKNKKIWRVTQWFGTGFLWMSWLAHDMANIVVYLPRQLDLSWLLFTMTILVAGLGWVFYTHGGKMQKIVLQKSGTRYVRSATIIDIVYAFILWFFKEYNDIPMSTSWVFVGLLCGRELAVFRNHTAGKPMKSVFPILLHDFFKLMIGLTVSLVFALLIIEVNR